MTDELPCDKADREAAENLAALLALPFPEDGFDRHDGTFDPWCLFPSLYGSYSGEFDRCAIEVLTELSQSKWVRSDLGAEMFREMLCTASLCDYGTSPRVCFPTKDFRPLVPVLLEKWKAYSLIVWGEDVCAGD
jgi:hypothetical protein